MTDEDRAVAAEAGGGRDRRARARRLGVSAAARRARRAAYDWFYNVVSNPMLWFLQHYLWELAYTPSVDLALQHAWDEGYARVNEASPQPCSRSSSSSPARRSSSTTTTCTSRRGSCASARPTRCSPTSSTSRGRRPDYWHVLPEPIRRAVHDGLLANDVIGFHTHRWRRQLPARGERPRRRRRPTSATSTAAYRRPRVARDRAPDLGRPGRVRRARRQRRGAGRRAGARRAAPGEARPARRPHRPLEEHRARLPRVRALPRRPSGDAPRGSGCSPCSIPRARTSPSTPSTSARCSARRAAVNDRFQQERLDADRARDRGRLRRARSPPTSSSTCSS